MARINYIIIVLLTFLLNSCLEDINNSMLLKFDNASDLITYVETRTSLLRGKDYPALVGVDELHQSLDNYLVLDIRTPEQFSAGHISRAISLDKSELLDYFKNINPYVYNKIVIVSNTGQMASLCAGLLLIAGYENIYVLDRGMTYWNSAFSDELRNAHGDGQWYFTYRFIPAIKPAKSNATPVVEYAGNPANIDERVEDRIQTILKKDEFELYISAAEFSEAYNRFQRWYDGNFVIYAVPDTVLPGDPPPDGIRNVFGPQSMVFYDFPRDFLSYNNLLTLPLDKNIVIYSPNGQRSSFYQAYLNFIGYEKTRSLKYGAISILDRKFINIQYIYHYRTGEIIDRIYTPTYLTRYGFQEEKVRNYSFEVGSP